MVQKLLFAAAGEGRGNLIEFMLMALINNCFNSGNDSGRDSHNVRGWRPLNCVHFAHDSARKGGHHLPRQLRLIWCP